MKIIVIASVSKNLVIGNKGKIPWLNKADLAHFKQTTLNNTLLMGRKTFESIGKALPGRLNLVVSKNKRTSQKDEAVQFFSDIEDALSFAIKSNYGDLFIIGGGEVFEQTFDKADELIISHFPLEVEGDTYFPAISADIWQEKNRLPLDTFHISYYSKRN